VRQAALSSNVWSPTLFHRQHRLRLCPAVPSPGDSLTRVSQPAGARRRPWKPRSWSQREASACGRPCAASRGWCGRTRPRARCRPGPLASPVRLSAVCRPHCTLSHAVSLLVTARPVTVTASAQPEKALEVAGLKSSCNRAHRRLTCSRCSSCRGSRWWWTRPQQLPRRSPPARHCQRGTTSLRCSRSPSACCSRRAACAMHPSVSLAGLRRLGAARLAQQRCDERLKVARALQHSLLCTVHRRLRWQAAVAAAMVSRAAALFTNDRDGAS